jgi:DNA-binding MarR family transcriptional regulator
MKTTKKSDFLYFFLEISEKLTLNELRLLYLLMTEPKVIELSQQEIADRIQAHRRTVNIGLKKLKGLKYIVLSEIEERKQSNTENQNSKGIKDASTEDQKHAKELILESFRQLYQPDKRSDILVGEDFYMHYFGDMRLHENLRYNREFITNTIKEKYPVCQFYVKQRKSKYTVDNRHIIIHHINIELIKAMKFGRYNIDKPKMLKYLSDTYLINKDETLKVIRMDFPVSVNAGKVLRVPKPWLKATGKRWF